MLLTKEVLRENYAWHGADLAGERKRLDRAWLADQRAQGISWDTGYPVETVPARPRPRPARVLEDDLPLPPRCRRCGYYLHAPGHEASCG